MKKERDEIKNDLSETITDVSRNEFPCETETPLCRSMLAKTTIQLRGIIKNLLPLTGGTINGFVWKLGTIDSAHAPSLIRERIKGALFQR